MAQQLARVLYNYKAAHGDELDIRFNEIVSIVSENSGADGWWEVTLRGKRGKIPSNYVEKIAKPSGPMAKALYDHTLQEITGQYLPFQKGDMVMVLDQDPDGWWLGYADEQQGLFPRDYVEIQKEVFKMPPRPQAPVAVPARPIVAASSCVEGDPMADEESSSDLTSDAPVEEDEGELDPLHEKLGLLLHDSDMSVVECMCTVLDPASSEAMAKVMVPVFEREGKVMDLIQSVIDMEIKRTTKASTLFRTNSMASQIMRCYARMSGKLYLSKMLKPLITEVNEFEGSLEIDPKKLVSEPVYKDVHTNMNNLKHFCAKFLSAITESLKTIPMAFHFVSSALVEGVDFKFPEAARVVIAGFYFLRFVCPAIVSPEGYDIVPKGFLNANGRRGLLLISKVVQNLANGVEFGVKEEFIRPMNDFVVAHFADIHYILDELPNIPPDRDIEPLPRSSIKDMTAYYKKLHEGISDNLEKIKKQYEEQEQDMEVFAELAQVIRQIGPTAAQLKKMEAKNRELLEADDDKRSKMRAAEKKKKEEEKKKAKEEKRKKEEEKKKAKKVKAPKTEKERKEQEELALITPREDCKVMCEGYLSRLSAGAIGKRWKKLYFVLYSGQPRIHFYKSQSDVPNIMGYFCLLPSFFVQNLPKSKHSGGHQFCVRTPSAEYQLMAHTEGELRMWLTTLNRHVNTISKPKTPEDKAVLISALQHKIIDQEEELDQVRQAYQVAKDDESRTKLHKRADELQASITALRQAHNKQKGTADPGEGGGDAPPPIDRSGAPPAVDRSSAPPSSTGATSAASSAGAGVSTRMGGSMQPGMNMARGGMPMQGGMQGRGAMPARGGMMPGAMGMQGRGMGMPGAGRGMQGGMMNPGMMGMQGGLPPGMTMQQYQLRQQQLYQQQMYQRQQQQYQAQMRGQPYGGGGQW